VPPRLSHTAATVTLLPQSPSRWENPHRLGYPLRHRRLRRRRRHHYHQTIHRCLWRSNERTTCMQKTRPHHRRERAHCLTNQRSAVGLSMQKTRPRRRIVGNRCLWRSSGKTTNAVSLWDIWSMTTIAVIGGVCCVC
jgi:hypothetical protein